MHYFRLISFWGGIVAYVGCINYIDGFMSMQEYMIIYCNVLLIYQFPLISSDEKVKLRNKILYAFAWCFDRLNFVQNSNNLSFSYTVQ